MDAEVEITKNLNIMLGSTVSSLLYSHICITRGCEEIEGFEFAEFSGTKLIYSLNDNNQIEFYAKHTDSEGNTLCCYLRNVINRIINAPYIYLHTTTYNQALSKMMNISPDIDRASKYIYSFMEGIEPIKLYTAFSHFKNEYKSIDEFFERACKNKKELCDINILVDDDDYTLYFVETDYEVFHISSFLILELKESLDKSIIFAGLTKKNRDYVLQRILANIE